MLPSSMNTFGFVVSYVKALVRTMLGRGLTCADRVYVNHVQISLLEMGDVPHRI